LLAIQLSPSLSLALTLKTPQLQEDDGFIKQFSGVSDRLSFDIEIIYNSPQGPRMSQQKHPKQSRLQTRQASDNGVKLYLVHSCIEIIHNRSSSNSKKADNKSFRLMFFKLLVGLGELEFHKYIRA
jgi:hypothetical protein